MDEDEENFAPSSREGDLWFMIIISALCTD